MNGDRVALGKIGKAHGVHGAFRVWPYAEDLERFARLQTVTLTHRAKSVKARVLSVRLAQGFAVVQTDAITSPEGVQTWLGGDLEIEASERIQLPEGRYFHDQIIGLRVETADGRSAGVITQIIDGPANDVYVCETNGRECLIPAVGEFIKVIDLAAGKVIIEPIPGMLD